MGRIVALITILTLITASGTACGGDGQPKTERAFTTPTVVTTLQLTFAPAATAARFTTPKPTATAHFFDPAPRPISLHRVSPQEAAETQPLPEGLYLGGVQTGDTERVDVPGVLQWYSATWLTANRLIADTSGGAFIVDIATAVATPVDSCGSLCVAPTESVCNVPSPNGALVARQVGGDFSVWSTNEARMLFQFEGLFGSWSPTGDRLSYLQDSAYDVVSVDQPQRVIHCGKGGIWAPDGSVLLYVDETGIWSVNPDGGEQKLLFALPNAETLGAPALSFDGKYASVYQGTTSPTLVIDLDTGVATQIPTSEPVGWSPVRDVLLAFIDSSGPEKRPALFEPDGTVERTLVVDSWRSAWSPDGTMLSLDGGRVHRLSDDREIDIPRFFEASQNWSPDSRYVAQVTDPPPHSICGGVGGLQLIP